MHFRTITRMVGQPYGDVRSFQDALNALYIKEYAEKMQKGDEEDLTRSIELAIPISPEFAIKIVDSKELQDKLRKRVVDTVLELLDT